MAIVGKEYLQGTFFTQIPSLERTPADDVLFDQREKATDIMQYGIQSAMIGGVSTILESVGIAEEGEVDKIVKENALFPELGAYYTRNKEGAKFVGDIVASFVPITVGIKAVRATSALGDYAAEKLNMPWAKNVLHSGKTINERVDPVLEKAMLLAKKRTKNFYDDSIANKDEIQTAIAKAKWGAAKDTMVESIAADAALYMTMNESEVFFPDTMSTTEYLAMFGIVNTAFSGMSMAITNRMIKHGLATGVAKEAAKAENLSADIIFREGNRGAGVGMHFAQRQEMDVVSASAPNDRTLQQNVSAEITTAESILSTQGVAMFSDAPLPFITTSVTMSKGSPEMKTFMAAGRKDPALFLDMIAFQPLGADAYKKYSTQLSKAVKQQEQTVKKARKMLKTKGANKAKAYEAINDAANTQAALNRTAPFVIEVDGSLVGLAFRKSIYQDTAPRKFNFDKDKSVILTPRTDKRVDSVLRVKEDLTFSIAPKLRVVEKDITTGATSTYFADLSLYEKTAMMAAAQKQLGKLTEESFGQLSITPDAHWLTKEAYAIAGNKFGIPTADTLQLDILSSKFDDYRSISNKQNMTNGGVDIIGEEVKLPFEDLARSINIPPYVDGVPNPLLELFADLSFSLRPEGKLKDVYKELKNLHTDIPKYVKDSDSIENVEDVIAYKGIMLEYPEGRKPFVAMYQHATSNMPSGTVVDIESRLYQQRTTVLEGLKNANRAGATLMGAISESVFRVPEALKATKDAVKLLREGTQVNKDRIFTAQFANRANQGIQDAHLMQDVIGKATLQWMKQAMEPFENISKEILRPRNVGELNSLMFGINARRKGWELESKPIFDDLEGKWFLKLKPQSTTNIKLWDEMGLGVMPKNARMPTGIGATPEMPAAFTDLAMRGFRAFNDLSKKVLANINHERALRGLAPIKGKEWHVLSKDMTAPESLYIVDDAGNFVQMVSGVSKREVTESANKVVAASDKNLMVVTREEVAKYADIEGKAFSAIRDFRSPGAQDGKGTGKSVGKIADIGQEAYLEMLQGYQYQFQSIGRRTTSLLFEPELLFAAQQKASARLDSATLKKQNSIWDQYEQALLGKGSLNKGTTIGAFHLGAESVYDTQLQKAWDKLVGLEVKTPFGEAMQSKEFIATAKAMGRFSPLKTLNEYAASTEQLTVPPSMRKHFAALNSVTAALSLRILDAGMAILNITSLAATTPAVIKMMQRQGGESVEDWGKRISAYGVKVTDDIATLDPTRTAITGTHFFWSKEGREVIKRAKERGYIKQEVAERMDIFQAPARGYAENLGKKAVDAMSLLTDKSEEFTRAYSFGVGYKMARNGLKLNDEAAMLFAHNFANKNIGDYRASIRPQLFQGAAGMPLGLFTTWIQNYLQRLYNTAENRQWGAVVNQMGLQAGLFGATSVPGFNQFATVMQSNYDGSENMVDRLYANYNDNIVDAVLYGSLSSIPKWVGAEDGIDLSSRAQIGFPGIYNAGLEIGAGPGAVVATAFNDLPVVNMLSSFKNITKEAVNSFKETGAVDASQMAEVTAQWATHKFTRAGIEVAQGYATDRRGDLLNADTQAGLSIAARALGLKPLREMQKQQALYRGRQIDIYQRELRGRLGKAVRQTFRDMDDEGAMEAFNDHLGNYIKSGGDMKNLKPWLAEQLIRASEPKADRELIKAMKQSDDDGDMMRLLRLAQ